jgi:hypothetical protein
MLGGTRTPARLGVPALDGPAALHVDVEDGDAPGGEGPIHRRLGAPVEVAVHLRPLHELVPLDHPLEGEGVDEVVIHPVALGALGSRVVTLTLNSASGCA